MDALPIEAGLLSADDWTARWITSADRPSRGETARPQHFRRAFTLQPPDGVTIERARLYATSAGINQLHLNGLVVGDTLLAPGWSAYPERLRYETHDVTALVAPGENVIGAVVADGWWRGYLGWDMQHDVYGDRLGLLAQLEVTFSDGTVETIATDDDAGGPRSVRSWAPTSTTANRSTRACAWTAGPTRASTTPHGTLRRSLRRRWAASSRARGRRCDAHRSCPSPR